MKHIFSLKKPKKKSLESHLSLNEEVTNKEKQPEQTLKRNSSSNSVSSIRKTSSEDSIPVDGKFTRIRSRTMDGRQNKFDTPNNTNTNNNNINTNNNTGNNGNSKVEPKRSDGVENFVDSPNNKDDDSHNKDDFKNNKSRSNTLRRFFGLKEKDPKETKETKGESKNGSREAKKRRSFG